MVIERATRQIWRRVVTRQGFSAYVTSKVGTKLREEPQIPGDVYEA